MVIGSSQNNGERHVGCHRMESYFRTDRPGVELLPADRETR